MNVNKVKSSIDKELWETTNIKTVKKENLENVLKITAKLKSAEDKADFRALCIQDIEESTKKPVIPRFLATIYGRHPIDDSYALSVFEEYYKESMWEELEYLGSIILSFNESTYVLKALADYYETNGNQEKKIATWERLIKTDHTETEVFYKLAEYYESKDQKQIELNLYKRVIQRHINASDFTSINNIWDKVITLKEESPDYLIQLATKVAKTLGNESGVLLLNEVLDKGNFDLNSNIKILKIILDITKNNKESTDKLISLFREKYVSNPRLEYCLSNSGLLHNYVDANIAVQNFEKEIEFTEGAFVYHNTWKLGRIRKIEQDKIQIQFLSQKELHAMSFNMAFSSLKILPKQHILVLKAGASPEKIKEHMLENIGWGLKMLLNSYNGQVTFKQIKAELVPSIFSDKEWTSWQSAAKKELASNPYFGTSSESNDVYVLRESPITYEEKTLQVFSREKGFFNKYTILKDFIKQNGNTDCEEFVKMINYFENEVRSEGCTGISSYLILDDFKNRRGMTFINLDKTFDEIYGKFNIEQIKSIYSDMIDSELRKQFVTQIMEFDPNHNKVLVALLHILPSQTILDLLATKTINNLRRDAVDKYETDPDFILWLLKETTKEQWQNIGMDDQDLIILKLQILLFVNSKISHDVDTAKNKARAKQITDNLFGESQEVFKFLSNCDTNAAKRVYSYSQNIPELDDDKKIGVKHFILSNRKDATEIVEAQPELITEERIIPKGFLCTKEMYNRKSAELEHIMNVEIPENSKEIGIARDLGDLRENAEYQYAKDKQKNLNFMMNKLTDEIDMANIIEPEKVDLNYVEFGTKVLFSDNIAKTDIEYTVFGPWESNPEKGILNFQAPLGLKIYNMKQGENKKFEINGVKFDYTVKKIELADFKNV